MKMAVNLEAGVEGNGKNKYLNSHIFKQKERWSECDKKEAWNIATLQGK